MNNLEAIQIDLDIGLYTDDPNSNNQRELKVVAKVIDQAEASAKFLEENFIIDTATWSLPKWEEIFNIKLPEETEYRTIEERRAVVKSKLRGVGTVNATLVKTVAESFKNGEVAVIEDFANYTTIIKFVGTHGIPSKIEDIKRALRDLIPAHLDVVYEFSYLFIKDVEAMSIAELEATPLSKFAGGVTSE